MRVEVLIMPTIKKSALTLWHFECPNCGFTDAEVGQPADAHTIHCEICMEEGRQIRLKRWPVEAPATLPRRRAA
jgi:transcription elongation factor Elf1